MFTTYRSTQLGQDEKEERLVDGQGHLLKGVRWRLQKQISNRGRLILRPIQVCQIEWQMIRYKFTKFLHNIATKEINAPSFLTFVGRWSAIGICCWYYKSVVVDYCWKQQNNTYAANGFLALTWRHFYRLHLSKMQ